MTVWNLLCGCENINFRKEVYIEIYNSSIRVVLHSFNECVGDIMDKKVIFFKVIPSIGIKIKIEDN